MATGLISEVERRADSALSAASQRGIHPLTIIVGGAIALYMFGGIAKKVAVPLGVVGTAYWYAKGKDQ